MAKIAKFERTYILDNRHLKMSGDSPVVLYGVFILIACAYYAMYFNYGIDLDDEGILIGGAAAVKFGQYPVADYSSYQPWMYFFLSGFFRAFGETLIVERLFLILHVVAAGTCLLWLSRKVLPFPVSLFPVALYVAAPGPWYKVFFIFHLLLVLVSLFNFNDRPTFMRAFVAGVAVGFAVISRIEVATISVLLFLGTLTLVALSHASANALKSRVVATFGNFIVYFAGIVLPAIGIAAVYFQAGKLDGLVENSIFQLNTDTYRFVIEMTGRADVFDPRSLLTHPRLEQWFYAAGLLSSIALLLFNLPHLLMQDPLSAIRARRKVILAASAIGSMGYTYFFVWNSRMLSTFPIVYLAEVVLLYDFAKCFLRLRWLAFCGQAALAIVVVLFCRANFYSGSLTARILTPGHSEHPFLKGMIIDASQAKSIDILYETAKRDPDAWLIAMSESTTMGYLSGLKNPTYYRLFTAELFSEKREHEAIAEFERRKIKYFVARSGQFREGGAAASDIGRYAPLIKHYLLDHYDIQALGDNYVLLVRRMGT